MRGLRSQACSHSGLTLLPTLSQLRTNVAAHHISSGILHGVARGAERFSVQAGSCRGIGRCLRRKRDRVSRHRRAVGDEKRGHVARIVIAQLEVRHGRGSGVGLRIFQPGIDPLARGLVGDVRQRRRIVGGLHGAAIGQLHRVAVHAAVASQQIASLVQLRRAGQRAAVALAAGRLDILRGKDRLLPRQRAVVCFGNGGGRALSAMADRAPELIELVGNDGMRAERLGGNIRQAGFFQPDVATGATVDYAKFGQPDLLNAALEVALQRVGIAAVADHPEIAVLVVTPLAEEILRGSDRQRDQKDQADDAEGAHAVSEQFLPERRKFFFHDRRIR